jgi:hypothetical protein
MLYDFSSANSTPVKKYYPIALFSYTIFQNILLIYTHENRIKQISRVVKVFLYWPQLAQQKFENIYRDAASTLAQLRHLTLTGSDNPISLV